MTIYAIGDIHGQRDLLHAAHDRIAADRAREGTAEAPVIHIGDLVDRGPDSAGVVTDLMEAVAQDPLTIVLAGNHDALFVQWLHSGSSDSSFLPSDLHWLNDRMGGTATVMSYGVPRGLSPSETLAEARNRVPMAHRRFLKTLPRMHRTGACCFVHAGIRPGVPLDAQAPEDLIWIRSPFLEDTREHGALIVHGHTPVDEVTHHGNRLAIDTGAGYGRALSAVAIEGRRVFLLTPKGRVRVEPDS